mmetsp:Transcript_14585/g.22212  ORF Transcript_14585/g.22212 Transcript_14585/m.22212 type:complete len:85 (-) Transcript_14585:3-257(-)
MFGKSKILSQGGVLRTILCIHLPRRQVKYCPQFPNHSNKQAASKQTNKQADKNRIGKTGYTLEQQHTPGLILYMNYGGEMKMIN